MSEGKDFRETATDQVGWYLASSLLWQLRRGILAKLPKTVAAREPPA